MSDLIFSSITGDNSDLIQLVSKMYLKPGNVVGDITYGKGVFWKKTDLSKYDFHPSDLLTCKNKYDFRHLPYENASFDAIIFDPPYCHNPGKMIVNANYKNSETTKGMYHKDIVKLYSDGMTEAKRVLKNPGGLLWIKCKDEIESSYQRWSHIELYNIAIELGFFAKDFFVITQKMNPIVQHPNQQHSRKNMSYLWIFKLPDEREKKDLRKFKIIKEASNSSMPADVQESLKKVVDFFSKPGYI